MSHGDPPSPQASAGQSPRSRKASAEPPIVHHHAPEELHNFDVAHEHIDVNVRAIIMFALGLVMITIVCALLVGGMFKLLENRAKANDDLQERRGAVSPLAAPPARMPTKTTQTPFFGAAPQPQLLTNEPAALRQLRQSEDDRLHGYGWVDEKGGVARIPIDEAKKLILERGLPTRAETSVDPQLGTHAPAYGESSSGRTIPTSRPAATAPKENPDKGQGMEQGVKDKGQGKTEK